MEFITTQKDGKAVLLEGCRYTLNRSMDDGRTYWRCPNRQCSARLVEQTGDHSRHLVDKLKSNMRKRAREEVTPIPSIYNETLVEIATTCEDVAPKMPTYAVVTVSKSPKETPTYSSITGRCQLPRRMGKLFVW